MGMLLAAEDQGCHFWRERVELGSQTVCLLELRVLPVPRAMPSLLRLHGFANRSTSRMIAPGRCATHVSGPMWLAAWEAKGASGGSIVGWRCISLASPAGRRCVQERNHRMFERTTPEGRRPPRPGKCKGQGLKGNSYDLTWPKDRAPAGCAGYSPRRHR